MTAYNVRTTHFRKKEGSDLDEVQIMITPEDVIVFYFMENDVQYNQVAIPLEILENLNGDIVSLLKELKRYSKIGKK